MDVADLEGRKDPRNVKGHDVDSLQEAMAEFGFTDPIELDERTGLLAAGHGRVDVLAEALARGFAPPEGVVEERLPDGGRRWLAPVIRGWESRDDTDAERYMAVANRLTEAGGWDAPALADMLNRQLAEGHGLPPGFDQPYLDGLLADLTPPDFQPTGEQDQPRLDRKFLLICANCGSQVDPAEAEKREA
jgi:hypothetical protein